MTRPLFFIQPRSSSKTEELLSNLLTNAIIYRARLNKSGDSFYIYLPRRYNNILKKLHEERREVRVIVIPS